MASARLSFAASLAGAVAIAMLAVRPAASQTPASRWLDQNPLHNWNKPNAAIPKGPPADMAGLRDCEKRGTVATTKAASTTETRQVAKAGWRGATVDKRAGDTAFVFARNGVDGMCRPLAYQIFVFVKGRFAGTLAPRPANSREDGSFVLEEAGADRFTASFARYKSDDPLCCPSRISTVTYSIRRVAAPGGGPPAPLVVPETAATKPTR